MNLSQQLRLIWIEGRARSTGRINRAEICEAWSISMPQATKDLVLFCELYPKRLVYDVRLKCYHHKPRRRKFRPDERAAQTARELNQYLEIIP